MLRIEFHSAADTLGQLSRGKRGATGIKIARKQHARSRSATKRGGNVMIPNQFAKFESASCERAAR
jgi:hypothetical protein